MLVNCFFNNYCYEIFKIFFYFVYYKNIYSKWDFLLKVLILVFVVMIDFIIDFIVLFGCV